MLRLDQQAPIRAERRYLWGPGDAGCIEVTFEDGRAFHRIDPAVPKARHDCAPDIYEVTYDFTDWPRWQSRWTVTGPNKAYVMTSDYTRLPAA